MPRPHTPLLPALVLLGVFLLSTQAADWPQWRGPDRSGHVAAGEKVPQRLAATPRVVWKIKSAEGLSSPVVAAGRVFHFEAANGREVLRALDAESGTVLWSEAIDDTFKDSQGPAGPRSTPVVDADRVYAVSCKGELQCRRVGDGRLVWRVNFTNDFGASFIGEKGSASGATRHGNNGSPLIVGDRLYAQAGGRQGHSIVCLDKHSGRLLWHSQDDVAGYAPPVIGTPGGVSQIVCFTAEGLIGLRERDGGLLWRVPMKTAFGRHVIAPLIHGDLVVVSSHQVGLIGTRVAPDGTGQKAEQAWLNKEASINFASPVLVDRHLYGLGPARDLICVDVTTGRIAWSQPGYFNSAADKAHAGLLVLNREGGGRNILCLTDGGELVLFPANPAAFQEISRSQVCGANWCNPAYSNGRLYVRDGLKTTGELVCVDLLQP